MKEETIIDEEFTIKGGKVGNQGKSEETQVDNDQESQDKVSSEQVNVKRSGNWKKAAAAAGGAAFGAGMASAFAYGKDDVDDDVDEIGTEENNAENVADEAVNAENVTPDSAWDGSLEMSHTNFDNMSFNEAFAAARSEMGPGGVFMYHGKPYNTFYAEEWNAMSDADKSDYGTQVNHAINGHDEPQAAGNSHEVPLDFDNISEENISVVDVDDDGNPDFVIVDDNGDGTPDAIVLDYDGDGSPDIAMDSDNDGIVEVYMNVDDEGYAEEIVTVDPDDIQNVALTDEAQEIDICVEEEPILDDTYNVDNECVDDYGDIHDGLM